MKIHEKIIYKITQWFQGYVLRDPDALVALEWIKNDRVHDFRHRYHLPQDAVIFDLGGHVGDWSAKLLENHPTATIYVFEVIPSYAAQLRRRFASTRAVKVCEFGLGEANTILDFTVDGLSSSSFRVDIPSKTEIVKARIVDVVDFIRDANIHRIDLMKVNIEGGEYPLLRRLISSDTVKIVLKKQIQFHNLGDWAIEERERIRAELQKTHELTYDYRWTFENWRLKGNW